VADDYAKPYLDSSVFIAWLRGEVSTNGVNRKEIVDQILDDASNGKHPIIISALTFAEVHKVKGDGRPHLTVAENEKILAFFERDFFRVVDVDRVIGEEANRYCRIYNIKPNDAIHLACALRAKCDTLLFWDRPFIAAVIHSGIRIEEPRITSHRQIPLPLPAAGEKAGASTPPVALPIAQEAPPTQPPTATDARRTRRDVNEKVKRIFDEVVEQSEQPPNRGELHPVEDPNRKPPRKK